MDNKNMKFNYFKAYEKLYEMGYHSKAKNHGKRYANYLMNNYKFKTVLDVGCSNGLAVNKFFRRKRKAYGIDVAHIAIRYAAEVFNTPNCILSSAMDTPFRDGFFDAVFSCDVLEHLTERDVFKALSEMHRITNKYLFLVLDCKPEGNREWIEKGKKQYPELFGEIENLHITIWDSHTWKKNIKSCGFDFVANEKELYIFKKRK